MHRVRAEGVHALIDAQADGQPQSVHRASAKEQRHQQLPAPKPGEYSFRTLRGLCALRWSSADLRIACYRAAAQALAGEYRVQVSSSSKSVFDIPAS